MDLFQGLSLDKSVSSFQNSTNSAMKGVKENNLTPADVTTTNMKQGTALKTARDTGVTGTITGYRSAVVEQLDGIIGALSGGFLNTKAITKSIKVGRDGVTFSDDALFKAVGGAAGVNVSSQGGAMRKLQQELAQEFKAITGLNMGSLITNDGKKFRVSPNWRSSIGQQTIRMFGKAAGVDDLLDVSAKGAFYNAVFKSSVYMGMTDSYPKMWNSYPKGFELIRRDAALEAMRTVITNGDIESFDAMLKLFDTNTKTVLLSKYPTFVTILFSNFRFDRDVIPEDYAILRGKLLTILEDLIGPEWWLKQTYFGKVLDLGLVNKASPDMIKLLQPVDDLAVLLCTANKFSDGSALAQLKRDFPGAPKYAF
jgi:hypothetical protein